MRPHEASLNTRFSGKEFMKALNAFDLDGNLTEDATRIYTYDGENRLVSVEPKAPAEGDWKASFTYDYLGRRVKKESFFATAPGNWMNKGEKRYLYDGWNMIRELDASGQTKKSYVWGIDLSGTLQGAGGIGGLLASTDASTLTHYYFDGTGNVGQLVDSATGNATAHYDYDPFGNVTYSSGPMAASNPYRFSTKYHDDETGLDYYGYRYYSPAMGRWINRDPAQEAGGLNLYSVNYNNFINNYDALGLWLRGDHQRLTQNAWRRLTLPNGLAPKYDRKMLDFLVKENIDVDSRLASDLKWHFNRWVGSSTSSAKSDYIANLRNVDKAFTIYVLNPTVTNCRDALIGLGNLSHSWQDYYAHAVKFNYVAGDPSWVIGNVTGSPDAIGSDMKPSSWGFVISPGMINIDFGEHGVTEPGERAPDHQMRLSLAELFTANKFSGYVDRWWKACKCQAAQVLP